MTTVAEFDSTLKTKGVSHTRIWCFLCLFLDSKSYFTQPYANLKFISYKQACVYGQRTVKKEEIHSLKKFEI